METSEEWNRGSGDLNFPPREPRSHRRAPVDHQDDREITPPPPRSPSPTYISLTEESSSRLSDPTQSRKLLILDLNGTLVHRSPNNPRTRAQFLQERLRGKDGQLLPRLRPVHPRPYMPAFRAYLFAPETRAWLDVMVWSSAQPYSVDDMVEHCFREQKEGLVAVWARDTLGLSEDHYRRKVQTVKDLSKPWSQLPALLHHRSPNSSIASTPNSSRAPSPKPHVSPQAHSALTTLLLDDSPRKAELQPYNHVCICEYSGERRVKDLQTFTRETEREFVAAVRLAAAAKEALAETNDALSSHPELDAKEAQYISSVADQTAEAEGLLMLGAAELQAQDTDPNDVSPAVAMAFGETNGDARSPRRSSEAEGGEDFGVNRKRKRKEKRERKRAERLAAQETGGADAGSYDEMLLAVIGVLDAIKIESNVAAWIRAGGLWGPAGAPPDEQAQSADDDDSTASSRASSRSLSPKRKREETHASGSTDADASLGKAGNDTVPPATIPSTPHNAVQHTIETSHDVEGSPPQKMWFEFPSILEFWTDRGRSALKELGIPISHGIER